jgi:hypothetical protein
MRSLLPRLPDVLAGKDQPRDPAQACAFASLCAQPFQQKYAASARLYAGAFAKDPQLATDRKETHRYAAACSAARAARGEGDGAALSGEQRTALRGQALAWLRAELELLTKEAASADGGERARAADRLSHWQADEDLKELRAGPGLDRLGERERQDWADLWAGVAAARDRAGKPAADPRK